MEENKTGQGGAAAQGVGMGSLQTELMAQLRRLNGVTDPQEVQREIDRSRAMADLGDTIIGNANTMLRAAQVVDGLGNTRLVPKGLLG